MNNVIDMEAAKGSKPIPLSERNDDQLMLLARGGMEEAFDALVRRHQQMVLRISMKYLQEPSLANDVAQNSFIDLYRSLPSYDPRGTFSSFLARITINRCRISKRQIRGEQKAILKFAKEPKKKEPLAEEHLLKLEQRRRVDRALGKLSPKIREVLILRYTADMSYKEIAGTLHLRLGTVKSRIFSGMENLHRILGGGNK